MSESGDRSAHIETFLATRFWPIGEDRQQTRRVLVKFLIALPEDLFSSHVRHLIVVAPPCGSGVSAHAFRCPDNNIAGVMASVVVLDARLEKLPFDEAEAYIFEGLFAALSQLDGLSDSQAQFVGREAARQRRTETKPN